MTRNGLSCEAIIEELMFYTSVETRHVEVILLAGVVDPALPPPVKYLGGRRLRVHRRRARPCLYDSNVMCSLT